MMQAYSGLVPSVSIAAFQPDKGLRGLIDLIGSKSPLLLLDTHRRQYDEELAGVPEDEQPEFVKRPPKVESQPAAPKVFFRSLCKYINNTPKETKGRPPAKGLLRTHKTLDIVKDDLLEHHQLFWKHCRLTACSPVPTIAFVDMAQKESRSIEDQVRTKPRMHRIRFRGGTEPAPRVCWPSSAIATHLPTACAGAEPAPLAVWPGPALCSRRSQPHL